MTFVLDLPADVLQRLQARWSDFPQRTREAIVVDAYRDQILSLEEVGSLLGHTTLAQTQQLLQKKGIALPEADAAEKKEELEAWLAQLDALANLLPADVPPLPEEAFRRETMYRE